MTVTAAFQIPPVLVSATICPAMFTVADLMAGSVLKEISKPDPGSALTGAGGPDTICGFKPV